jgi:phospholipase/carboxylesterase
MSNIHADGKALENGTKVAIMIHGRGGTAKSMLSLNQLLNLQEFAQIAPQAPGNTWYPYSFMAPDQSNEPDLSQSLQTIHGIVRDLEIKGFTSDQLYFIGFSQGACLALEYTTRHAKRYGGIVAFTGGLIGEKINPEKYSGNFQDTPVFIGGGFKDPHVPLQRIEESAALLREAEANVISIIFKDLEHTIRQEEMDWVNHHILS